MAREENGSVRKRPTTDLGGGGVTQIGKNANLLTTTIKLYEHRHSTIRP